MFPRNRGTPRRYQEKNWRVSLRASRSRSPETLLLSSGLLKEDLRLLSASHNLSPETFERVQNMRRQVYDSHDYQEGIKMNFSTNFSIASNRIGLVSKYNPTRISHMKSSKQGMPTLDLAKSIFFVKRWIIDPR